MKSQPGGCYPYVSVIVPAKNEAKHISKCLMSIKNQDYPKDRYDITVIDNKSTDNTFEIAKNMGVAVLSTSAKKIGQVRNYGVENTSGDIVCFIDGDCIAKPDWLSSVSKLLDCKGNVAAVGGDAYVRDNATKFERYWFFVKTRRTDVMSSLNGASMSFFRSIFYEVGGFREDINAGEDSYLSNEIKLSGYTLIWHSSADVIHLGYPRTIWDFCVRQFWLSSSYIKSNTGVNEKMFWFSALCLVALVGMLISSIFLNFYYFIAFFVAYSIGPLLLCYKKGRGGGVPFLSAQSLSIMGLSYLYFFSRSLGLAYSVTGRDFDRKKR